MEEEGKRRRDLRQCAFAWPADVVELRPYACQDFGRPCDAGAELVHIGFACPFDLGGMRQLVPARTGKRVEVALNANLNASPARLDLAARALDGGFARLKRGAKKGDALGCRDCGNDKRCSEDKSV